MRWTDELHVPQCSPSLWSRNYWGVDRGHHSVCSMVRIICRIATWHKTPNRCRVRSFDSPRHNEDVIYHYPGYSWYTLGYVITMAVDALTPNWYHTLLAWLWSYWVTEILFCSHQTNKFWERFIMTSITHCVMLTTCECKFRNYRIGCLDECICTTVYTSMEITIHFVG